MPDIFISYARDNSYGQHLAERIHEQLRDVGFTVFRDVRGIAAGDQWVRVLEAELTASRLVVLVVSQKVLESRWVFSEITLARREGIPVVPVLAEAVKLPLWLLDLQALDFSTRVDWAVLLDAVRKKIPPVPPFAKGGTKPVWACQEGDDAFGRYADLAVAGVTQRMRWIEAGTFLMGSPPDETGRGANELQHEVTLKRGFWLADTACTQALWQAVMGGNPSHFKGAEHPVESVDWYKAQKFLRKLGGAVAGLNARLPTEAEWEYACRAGTTTAFAFDDTVTAAQAQVNGRQTVAVKSLPANPWGLYAMHGNVWEWVQDGYGEYPAGAAVDPVGDDGTDLRVLRGGSWVNGSEHARSATRGRNYAANIDYNIGFRFAVN